MRFARRWVVVVPLALGSAAAVSLGQDAPPPGGSRGVSGAVLGEKPGVAPRLHIAAVGTQDSLGSVHAYLMRRGAKRIEDLSVEDLKQTAQTSRADAPWRVRLAQLAKEELGRRHVTDDPFPSPAMPDEPDAREPMKLTAGELEVLARIVKGETWVGTPPEGEIAVASVVLNRVVTKGFPGTVAEVAHQPLQFSCYNIDVRDQLYWGPIRASALDAAKKAASGVDPVGGATHYFNPYLVKPAWAKTLHFVKRIGTNAKDTHDFYR